MSNVHNIVHISDDIDRFGYLNNLSTYPFENFLRHIKLLTRSSNLPLEQITRRLVEISTSAKNKVINFNTLPFQNSCFTPILKHSYKYSNFLAFKSLQVTPNVILSNKKCGDRWFLTTENEIVGMIYAIKEQNSIFIHGFSLESKQNFLEKPYSSHYTGIYISNGNKKAEQRFPISKINCKMVCLSYNEKFVYIPLLHSIDEISQVMNSLLI